MENKIKDWVEIEDTIKQANGTKLSSNFGINGLSEIKYNDIDFGSSRSKNFSDFKHAAHVFLWTHNHVDFWGNDPKAAVLMQIRFDGCIGFPGGFIDVNDLSIEDGLNRELKEEMNLSIEHHIKASDHLFSHLLDKPKIILHFYAKYVTMEQFRDIERNCLTSSDWGFEVAGILRPPLYELKNGRGLSQFLLNKFAGNAAYQLLRSLFYMDIINQNEILNLFRQ